jgi:tungstate transport system substrate-binding protein
MKTIRSEMAFKPQVWVRRALMATSLLVMMGAQAQSIVVASTTSTEQSGLFGYLLPEFKKASGIDVKVVALGTGQAIDMGRRGDADVLFVHDQVAEEKVVAEGFAVKRIEVSTTTLCWSGRPAIRSRSKARMWSRR